MPTLPAGRGSLPVEATRFLQRARILDATAQAVAQDGYAATSVCEAGVESLSSGLPVEVKMVSRDSIPGA